MSTTMNPSTGTRRATTRSKATRITELERVLKTQDAVIYSAKIDRAVVYKAPYFVTFINTLGETGTLSDDKRYYTSLAEVFNEWKKLGVKYATLCICDKEVKKTIKL